MPPPSNPFFIIGHPRSGTTLLRFILSSHPRLYIPDETGFIPFLRVSIDQPLSLADVEALLGRIGRLNRFWDGLVVDTRAFYQSLAEPRLASLLDALYHQRISEHHASRWGDKTPGYVQFIPYLTEIFPSAQFIHLIRDGRDAALSARRKWGAGRFYLDTYYLMQNWVSNVRRGMEAGSRLGPERYLEVFYEDLVRAPDTSVKEICTFLGEVFYPSMLSEHKNLAEQVGDLGQAGVLKPIFTSSTQRWKTEMSPFEQKIADQLAGPTLTLLGYELAGLGPFTLVEKLQSFALAVKYQVTSTLRRVLYAGGLLTLNRGMRRR